MKLQPKIQGKAIGDLGTMSRFIWTRLAYHQMFVNTPLRAEPEGTRVLLSLGRGQGKPVTIDLTSLTAVELAAFKQTVLIATEIAEPICEDLDRRALEELENGNDANPRCYRPLPTVVVRPRAFREYSGRLLDGRTDVLSGVQLNVMPGGGLADDSGNLDEYSQEQSDGGEDNP